MRPMTPAGWMPLPDRTVLSRKAEIVAALEAAIGKADVISDAAETIAYDDYVAYGGETGARDAGKMRLEGREYVVKDGDVLHIRFAT